MCNCSATHYSRYRDVIEFIELTEETPKLSYEMKTFDEFTNYTKIFKQNSPSGISYNLDLRNAARNTLLKRLH